MSETIETMANLEAIHGPDFLEAVNRMVNTILAEQDRILQTTVKILLPVVGGTFITDSAQRAVDKIAALQAENAALTEQLAAREWQPIESAPKDGTQVLLMLRHRIVCGRWNADSYAKKPQPYWTNDSEHIFGKMGTRKDHPTHWQSLPAAPVSQQEKVG